MKRKIVISIFAIVAAFAAAMPSILPDSDEAAKLGKEFAAQYSGADISISVLEAEVSEQEEVNRAELIAGGTIIDIKPFWKIVREDSPPRIYSEYMLKVSDVIKGSVQEGDTVSVVMAGGSLDGIEMKYTDAPDLQQGDNVIMLLGRDASIYGSSYHPVSVLKSTYIIDGSEAKNNFASRNMDKELLREKLTQLSD